MVDLAVTQRGIDSSGRGVFLTNYAWSWWDGLLWELQFTPTITQGGWQLRNGGGAAASAGYHDKDAIDIRVWDLTPDEVQLVIRTARANGAMAWLRGPTQDRGGMDPHIHIGVGGSEMAPGLQSQWWDYQHGGNGLTGASAGPDYHWRPSPLVTRPPKGSLMPTPEDIAKATWNQLILPVGGEAGDEIPARRMLAQIHNRTSPDKLAAAIADADPSLPLAKVTAAVKKALVQIGSTP